MTSGIGRESLSLQLVNETSDIADLGCSSVYVENRHVVNGGSLLTRGSVNLGLVLLAIEQVSGLEEDVTPLAEGGFLPSREGTFSGLNGVLDILARGRRGTTNNLLREGVPDLEARSVAGGTELAVNEERSERQVSVAHFVGMGEAGKCERATGK